nr:HTH-type transcriptional regulator PgrR [Paraburkholderia busanensis]
MDQIQAMRVFVKIADTQSFRRAAQLLDMSNANVTRSIALLEAHLQTRLINRTTRNVSLTPGGLRYLQGCRCVLEEFDLLDRLVVSDVQEPSGTLNILAAEALSQLSLTPLLDGYRRRHPKVHVRLTLAEFDMDSLTEHYSGLYDVGIITTAAALDEELVQRPLGANQLVMCAAPGYITKHGEPVTLDELANHSFVGRQEGHLEMLNLTDTSGKSQSVSIQTVYTVNSVLMVRLAAIAAMGIAILPSQLIAGDLNAGSLTRILPNYEFDDSDETSIVYPRRQYLPAKTTSFIDYTLEYFTGKKLTKPAINNYIPPYRYDLPED